MLFAALPWRIYILVIVNPHIRASTATTLTDKQILFSFILKLFLYFSVIIVFGKKIHVQTSTTNIMSTQKQVKK